MSARDKALGALVAAGSIVLLALYLLVLWKPPRPGWDLALLKLTASIAVAAVALVAAWIGYTIATTPPPRQLEEVEKEIEEEIKRLEREAETSTREKS